LYDASCNFVYEYNPGTGSGATSWAPIMGNSYGKTLTLWHKGTTTQGCTKLQDDLAILGNSTNGFGLKVDSVGNTHRTSTQVAMTSGGPLNSPQPATKTFTVQSEINTSDDVDIFRIDITEASRYQMTANPAPSGTTKPNVDLQLSILNDRGNELISYNPASTLGVSIDTMFTPGTYYLKLSNAANANVSNYGMLGDYVVSGAALPSTLPIQSMKLTGKAVNNKHELNWNIIADEPIESIVVETSTTGSSFSSLQSVSSSSTRFDHQPSEKKTVFYRLFVTTASQLKYYSNVVALREVGNSSKFDVVTNIITKNEVALNSNGSYNWRILDMSGRSVANGKTSAGFNLLQTGAMTSGMYLFQIIDGTEITTEKIVKQ
jgi:hypothetical protein